MNKAEFSSQLEAALKKLSPQERGDILNDYEEHFRIGSEMGKTEEEIAETLGNPNKLEDAYVDGNPVCHLEYAQAKAQILSMISTLQWRAAGHLLSLTIISLLLML